jgi:DNA repair protein RecO (recombination protein O)
VATYLHTEGICLRRIEYSNTSQVASFLTPDVGRLSVMAKGVTRAPKKGIRTGFDLLGRYELIYTPRRAGSLQNLTYRNLRDEFRGLRDGVKRILCGYYAAELALNLTIEGDPCPALYALMLRSLDGFARGRKLGVGVLLLELGALREHGSCPRFDACADCGRPAPRQGTVAFSPAAGGPLCDRCEQAGRAADPRATTTRAGILRTLAALSSCPDVEAAPRLTPGQVMAAGALLRFYMRDLLGRELRMWKYVQRRQLSRSLQRLRRRATRG